uniref:Uncharacterized protein n=1 Tax=Kalanchoe fedtschenkoi TaxID=63787 RepID=A0A7N0TGS4_KALFE
MGSRVVCEVGRQDGDAGCKYERVAKSCRKPDELVREEGHMRDRPGNKATGGCRPILSTIRSAMRSTSMMSGRATAFRFITFQQLLRARLIKCVFSSCYK